MKEEKMTYEIVHEIFNLCKNNQMRDVFIQEREVEDPATYVRENCRGEDVEIEETLLPNGTRIFDVRVSGMRQRYTFTP